MFVAATLAKIDLMSWMEFLMKETVGVKVMTVMKSADSHLSQCVSDPPSLPESTPTPCCG